MFEYEYEQANCELGGWGAFGGNVYSIDDYKSIIDITLYSIINSKI